LKPIVTLTTDLGGRDFYLSTIKAKLLSQDVDCHIIDISHEIDKFNIAEAAFVLKNVMTDFPKGTIHIIGVGSGATDEGRHLGIQYKGQYILTADNGFFSLIADHHPDLIVDLQMNLDTDAPNFPTRDLYVPAALHLARGGTLEVIGRRTEQYAQRTLIQPVKGEDYLKGMVIYVDAYGNAITNIEHELFKKVGKGRHFLIGFIHKGYEIDQINHRYSDASEGERLAMFNSAGYLEIAINHGHAGNLLGLEKGETIIVSFD
jgi:S-adenosyl-L-methionine hydrolase (adenosine-forming)